jgi:hypothetical protein
MIFQSVSHRNVSHRTRFAVTLSSSHHSTYLASALTTKPTRQSNPKNVTFKIFSLLSIFALVFAFCIPARPACADIFYTASNYSAGSAGIIRKSGDGYDVLPRRIVNFGRDAAGFSFKDHNGNRNDWGSNIHSVASSGRHSRISPSTVRPSTRSFNRRRRYRWPGVC